MKKLPINESGLEHNLFSIHFAQIWDLSPPRLGLMLVSFSRTKSQQLPRPLMRGSGERT